MTTSADYLRVGALNLAAYLPNPAGTPITTIGTFTVGAKNYTVNELKVTSGTLFNRGSLNATLRKVRPFILGLNGEGDLIPLLAATESNLTPGVNDNACEVSFTVPAGALYAGVLIDDKVAQLLPVPPRARQSLIATPLTIPVFYEPTLISATKADLDKNALGQTLRQPIRQQLPNTTGEASHGIEFTKIDIPINNSANQMITTRSSQKFEGNFVAPRSEFIALQTAGTRFDGCGCAPAMTQVGFRGGSCDQKRIFEITLPGDRCGGLVDGLLFSQAVFGENDLTVNYSSESAANLPFSIKEASSMYFNGLHSFTLVDYN